MSQPAQAAVGNPGNSRGCGRTGPWRRAPLLVLLAVLVAPAAVAQPQDPSPAKQPDWTIACDLASYGPWRSLAWNHLSEELKLRQVVLAVPEPQDVAELQARLAEHGMTVLALRGRVDLASRDAAGQIFRQLARCNELGAKCLLLSALPDPAVQGAPAPAAAESATATAEAGTTPSSGTAADPALVALFRAAGAEAQRRGLTIGLTNGPPLAPSGTELAGLLAAIDHPSVRADFDTASPSERGAAVDEVAALDQLVDRLATVTLADHDAQAGSGKYPALGSGKVYFAGVFALLWERGYAGPLVVRCSPAVLKPTGNPEADQQAVKDAVADSVGFVLTLEASLGRITTVDYAMLVGYFVLMLLVGVYFARSMRGMKDYFSGGNKIPWWLSGVSFYMSSFSAFAFISFSALAFRHGWVSVTLLWVTVPATVFSVLLFARRWRRARIDSPVEYLETRYSGGFRQLVAWQGIPVKIIDDALKLVAIAAFLSVILQQKPVESMIWSGAVILAYTFLGGLWAVVVTDFIQFVVMAVAILILIPLAIARIGGLDQINLILPQGVAGFFTAEYNWVYVVLLSFLYCVHWSSMNWPLIQRYYCVANEREAVKVGWLVTLLNVLGPPLMFLPALAAAHFLPASVPGKFVYPRLCIELLPAGILGLVVAAMFSATMSMLSSDYNACAGVLTGDVYRRLLRPRASQRELVLVGRLMTLVVGGLALGAAVLMVELTGEGLFKMMVTLFSVVTAPVGVPMILGLLSRRVTNRAALVGWFLGIVVGLAMLAWCPAKLVFHLGGPGGVEFFSTILEKEIAIFTATLLVSLAATLVVSLAWPMPDEEARRVDDFHRRLAVPIGQLEEDRAAATTAFSPFGVVGVSIMLIGLLLLAMLPWIALGLAFNLTVAFGVALLLIGSLMLRRRKTGAELFS